MMRKTKIALGATAALVALAAGTTIVNLTRSPSAVAANAEIYRQLDLFGDVLERVRSDYVEKPDDQKLIESAINGMLSALDPHSAYLNVKHFRDMQVQTRGEFGGLGIEVTMENGVVKVVAPIEDTPAQRAGVMSGDLITHLDSEQILGLTLQEAVEKMRGPVNSPIELTVVRKNVEEPVKIKLTRDIIRINPVKVSVEGDDVGLIRMTTFNEQTYTALKDGIDQLERDAGPKLRGYVLDLRNNPGGLLDQAIAVSDAFLDKGAIVITRGRNMEETQRSNARAGDLTNGRKIVVLINGGAASASEIVAGALQDHHRATIVGTRSFGKGSVQTIIPLGTNGAIRLTTARYYTPAGRSIQAKGIEPNIVVEQELPEEMKAKMTESPRGEASLRGHLLSEDGKETEESGSNSYVPPEKEKDVQLIYAMDILRGIKAAETGSVNKATETDAAAKAPVPN